MRASLLLFALALTACDAGGSIGTSCSHVSQCEALLTCQLGHCRRECTGSPDCAGGSCVFASDDPAAPGACTLDVESTCTSSSCPDPLVCTPSGCRTPCSHGCRGDTTCTNDVCTPLPSTTDSGAVGDAG